ncbi:MAG: iron-sulfur cluster repair di-iron protein, ric [Christensenellales bacterium]|jgi:iron-sulfur cluster repair protein YtfE (RIC family)
MSIKLFNEAKAKYMKTLKMYVPVVARVHGQSHPEFHEVHALFDALIKKTEAQPDQPELGEEFSKLRKITKDYAVPDDVCESYEAVYSMLAELDRAYHA